MFFKFCLKFLPTIITTPSFPIEAEEKQHVYRWVGSYRSSAFKPTHFERNQRSESGVIFGNELINSGNSQMTEIVDGFAKCLSIIGFISSNLAHRKVSLRKHYPLTLILIKISVTVSISKSESNSISPICFEAIVSKRLMAISTASSSSLLLLRYSLRKLMAVVCPFKAPRYPQSTAYFLGSQGFALQISHRC